jgi:hypothetical protein
MRIYVYYGTNVYSHIYFFMYNYYAITILLPWILHIHKLCQTFEHQSFNIFSQVYFIKFSTFYIKLLFSSEGVFKISNTHLSTN